VDEFIRASEAEKQRLAAAIADDEDRSRRARAAIGMHNMMVSMLIETQRELEELRRDAERSAAEIISAASDPGQVVPGSFDMSPPLRPQMAVRPPGSYNIDLVAEARADRVDGSACASPLGPADTRGGDASGDLGTGAESNDYFAFLRGALTDEEPLGPRNSVGASE
jgi:hypothetical protein